MSHPARAPRSGIDGKTNAAGGRNINMVSQHKRNEAERVEMDIVFAESPVDGVGVSTSIRPGRSRSRSKEVLEEKIKGTPPGERKKLPPARKAPSRGRYVDEYARPSGF